jgi:hypothetical protein
MGGYFGALDDPQAAQQRILAAQGPVWRVIASFGEEDAVAMGGGASAPNARDQSASCLRNRRCPDRKLKPTRNHRPHSMPKLANGRSQSSGSKKTAGLDPDLR